MQPSDHFPAGQGITLKKEKNESGEQMPGVQVLGAPVLGVHMGTRRTCIQHKKHGKMNRLPHKNWYKARISVLCLGPLRKRYLNLLMGMVRHALWVRCAAGVGEYEG